MSEFKGTPGPWFAVRRTFYNAQTGERGVSCHIATGANGPRDDGTPVPTHSGHNMVPVEVAEANARLMAAAPDLLAAAEAVLAGLNARLDAASMVGGPMPVFDGIADLHTAIAKAKGVHP
jgi:hypothetical protein